MLWYSSAADMIVNGHTAAIKASTLVKDSSVTKP